MSELRNLIFEVTSDCNLDCRYCYNHWKAEPEHQSLNSYKNAIKTLKQIFKQTNVKHITFTGGEPFVSERFIELILFCRIEGKTVSIISNGTVAKQIDYERCVQLGVSHFQFPILSSNPAIHDSITGVAGSWQKTINSIASIQQLNTRVVPVLVLSTLNADYIEQTIRFIHSLGMRQIMLNRYNIGGKYKNTHNLLLDRISINKAFSIANNLATELNLYISSNVCSPICYINPEDFPHIAFGHCSFDMYRRPITVSIDGNLRLCNHSPQIAGNIFTQTISEIFESDYCKSWQTIKPTYCNACQLYDKCKAGCRAASEQMGLGLSAPDPVVALCQ